MKYSLLTTIGLFTLAIGVSFVYAEEQTIDVPFDVVSTQCTQDTDELIVYCAFMGMKEYNITIGGIEVSSEPKPEPVIEEEIITEPEVKLTRGEKDIQRMIDRITLDLQENPDTVPHADRQLLELLLRAQEVCEFGIEEGAPIQTYQIFAIPEGYFYPADTDFSKYNMLGKITQLVEACTKWEEYKPLWLGPQYDNIRKANEEAVIWTPTATIPYNVTITAEFMNRAISEHDKIEEVENAFDDFCRADNYKNQTKAMYGCDVDLPTGVGGYVDITDNPALAKYYRYLEAPERAIGEPRYDEKENPKCYILHSFIVQNEISKEKGDIMMEAAGCKI